MSNTEKLLKVLRQFEADLGEIKLAGDLKFQKKRLKKMLDDFDATNKIHGSGTGTHD